MQVLLERGEDAQRAQPANIGTAGIAHMQDDVAEVEENEERTFARRLREPRVHCSLAVCGKQAGGLIEQTSTTCR